MRCSSGSGSPKKPLLRCPPSGLAGKAFTGNTARGTPWGARLSCTCRSENGPAVPKERRLCRKHFARNVHPPSRFRVPANVRHPVSNRRLLASRFFFQAGLGVLDKIVTLDITPALGRWGGRAPSCGQGGGEGRFYRSLVRTRGRPRRSSDGAFAVGVAGERSWNVFCRARESRKKSGLESSDGQTRHRRRRGRRRYIARTGDKCPSPCPGMLYPKSQSCPTPQDWSGLEGAGQDSCTSCRGNPKPVALFSRCHPRVPRGMLTVARRPIRL